MSEGDNLIKQVFHLAWPSILNNLFQTLAVTADIIMVGTLGRKAVGGVTIGGQVFFILMTVLAAVTAGTVALVSRFTGSGETKNRDMAVGQSYLLAAVISIPFFFLGTLRPDIVVGIYGASLDVSALAAEYTRFVFAGSPLFAVMAVSAASFIATGDAKTPMCINGTTNAFNVFFNYIFIFGKLGMPAMGVKGAGLGTLLSFLVGAMIYASILISKKRDVQIVPGALVPDGEMMTRIVRIGLPAATEQVAIQIGFLIYMIMVVRFGDAAVAAHSIGMRVQSLSFMPGLGFATAATALSGRYLGERAPETAEKSGWLSLKLAILTMGSLGLLLFVFARPVAEVFIRDETVVTLSVVFIRILAIGEIAIATHFTLAGALRGAGDTKYPLYASLFGLYGFRIPLAMVLGFHTSLGLYGVWLAMVIEYYARSTVIFIRYRSGRWKAIRV